MPVPFGVSPSDFIAGADLVHSVCEALQISTGAAAQYQGVSSALASSKEALEPLESIVITQDERIAVNRIIERAKETLLQFANKIQKYDATLGKGKDAAWWRSLPKKIQWQRYSSGDIRWFQDELVQHSYALQIVVAKIQNAASARGSQETNGSILRLENNLSQLLKTFQEDLKQAENALCSRIDLSNAAALTRFDRIEVEAANRFDRSQATALHRFQQREAAAQPRLDMGLASTLHIFRDVMLGLFVFLIRLFENIKRLHGTICQVPQSIFAQASSVFEDAHGFIYHINTDFIQSWRAFFFVLEDNFRDKPGFLRVVNGKYRLYDRFGSRSIQSNPSFSSVFRPGRQIRQIMLFAWDEVQSECCPKCKKRQAAGSDTEIQCDNTNCGFWYRKLENVIGKNDTPREGDHSNLSMMTVDLEPYRLQRTSDDTLKPDVEDKDRPEDFLRIVVGPKPFSDHKREEANEHALEESSTNLVTSSIGAVDRLETRPQNESQLPSMLKDGFETYVLDEKCYEVQRGEESAKSAPFGPDRQNYAEEREAKGKHQSNPDSDSICGDSSRVRVWRNRRFFCCNCKDYTVGFSSMSRCGMCGHFMCVACIDYSYPK